MSLPLAQPRRAQTSAVTAPAAEKAEATTSTSFATASSAKDRPKPETMSRLPYPNYPLGLDSPNLTHNPSQRRSSYPEAEHSQAYPPQYAHNMLQPGPMGPVPFTSASSLQPYANQASHLQPVLEPSGAGARAARTHFEQAAAASVNATNALKVQITADVQHAVETLGKRLEDRMDRRDKADDERHTAQLQVLSQVLTALKDLDKRVGRSSDERSVMTRLTAIEFTAGDAWEGRKDPQADDGESDVEQVPAPIATPTIAQSLSSKGSRQPSATPSKEREGSLVHAPENGAPAETAQLPDIEVNSPTPPENLPPPPASIVTTGLLAQTEDLSTRSPFDATSSGVQTPAFSDAMELEYPPESSVTSVVEPLHQPQQPPQQPLEQLPKSTPCTEEDRRLSRVDWSQENQDLGASQHAAIFKPDNSPQAIKASSSYSPRPPMDGSVASLRLETLGDASFMGDDDVATSTPVKTKVIPVVAPPAVSPLPSPATSPSVSPKLRASRRLSGSAARKEEEEEEQAGGVEAGMDSDHSVPAIEAFVEEHERDSEEEEDVEMEEAESGVLGDEMDSLDHSMEVEVPEPRLEEGEEAKDRSAVQEEVEATKNDLSTAEDSLSIQLDEDVRPEEPAQTRVTSQSPIRQMGGEASEAPLLPTTVSGEPVVEPSPVPQLEEDKEERLDEGHDDHKEDEEEAERGVGQADLDVADHYHDVEPASGALEEEPLERRNQHEEREREPSEEPEEPLFLEGDPSDMEEQDSTTHHQEDTTIKTEPEPEPTVDNDGQVNGFDPLPDSDLGITSDFDEEEYASAIWMSMQLPPSSPVKAGGESPLRRGTRTPTAAVVVSPSKSVTPRRSASVLSRSSPTKRSGLASQRQLSSSFHSAEVEVEGLEEAGKDVAEDNGEVDMETIENDEHVVEEDESPIHSFSTLQPTFRTSPIHQSTPARDKGNTMQPLFEGTDIDVDSLPPPPSSSPFCYPDSPDKGKEAPEVAQEEEVVARSPSMDNVSLGSEVFAPPAAENVAMNQDVSVDDLTIMPTMEDDVDGGLEYVDEPEPQIAAPAPRVPTIPEDDDEPPLPKPRQKYRSPSVSESEAEAEAEKVASPRTPARPPSSQSQSISASTRMSQRNRRSPSKADMYLRPSSLSASAGKGDRSPNHPVSRTLFGTPGRKGSPLKSINLSTKLKKPTPRKGPPPPPPTSTEDVIEISSGSSPEQSPRVLLQQKISKQKKKMEIKKEKEKEKEQQQQQKTTRKVSSSSAASGGKGNADASAEADVIDLTMSNAEEEHQSSDSEPAFDFDSDDSTEIIRGAPRKAAGTGGAASKPPGSQAKAPAAPVQQKRLADRLVKPGQSAAATRIKRKQRPAVDGDNDDRPLKRAKSVIGAAVPVTKSKLLGRSRAGTHASSASSNNSKAKGKDWSEKGGDSSDGSMIVVKREKEKGARTSTGGDSSSSSKIPSNRSSSSSVLLDEDGSRKLRHRTVDSKNNEVKWPTFNKHGSRKFQRELIKCDMCSTWYHYGCVGIEEADPRLEDSGVFTCPPCLVNVVQTHLSDAEKEQGCCGRLSCHQKVPRSNEYFVERIVGRKQNPCGRGYLWLVKWDGYAIEQSTWQSEKDMSEPAILIEAFGEAAERERRNISNPFMKVLLKEVTGSGWKDIA